MINCIKRSKFVKIFLSFTLLFTIFFPVDIKAADSCDTYQCITCEVEIAGNVKGVYQVKANGTGGAKISFKGDNPGGIYTYDNSMQSKHFISSSSNKLTCPNNVYLKLTSGNRNQTVAIYSGQDKKKTLLKKPLKKTKDNKKPFVKETSPKPSGGGSTVSKSCTYSANGVIASVVVDGDTVDIQLEPSNYRIANHDLQKDMFSGKCPTLQFACVPSQNVCSIFKNSESGGHTTEGEETKDADQLAKDDVAFDRMPASSTDPELSATLSAGQDSCEILRQDSATYALIKKIVGYVQIGTVFLVLVLGMLDLAGAVGSQDEGSFKKAAIRFAKRLLAGSLVFLVPAIVGILMGLLSEQSCDNSGTLGGIYSK